MVEAANLGFQLRVEQYARSFDGTFFRFNGTGGVWRRIAIEDVGNWSTVSVVEDVDLSLRTKLIAASYESIDSEVRHNLLTAVRHFSCLQKKKKKKK